jgi:cytochrome P450
MVLASLFCSFANRLTFELAKAPHFQRRLQEEVDALFAVLETESRPMDYRDCRQLPFLSRCIFETLRLWPAVANGTFRELQYDDYVVGEGGGQVKLKKGTYVQVSTWPRHRNPKLWGDDCNQFNPDRDFGEDEVWRGDPFMAYNPSSKRFSPFTFGPRDCIGKNFAQVRQIQLHCVC